eukprot:scaffold97572_cov73-Phaeocystis_antarctica.AAC.1
MSRRAAGIWGSRRRPVTAAVAAYSAWWPTRRAPPGRAPPPRSALPVQHPQAAASAAPGSRRPSRPPSGGLPPSSEWREWRRPGAARRSGRCAACLEKTPRTLRPSRDLGPKLAAWSCRRDQP